MVSGAGFSVAPWLAGWMSVLNTLYVYFHFTTLYSCVLLYVLGAGKAQSQKTNKWPLPQTGTTCFHLLQ